MRTIQKKITYENNTEENHITDHTYPQVSNWTPKKKQQNDKEETSKYCQCERSLLSNFD